MAIIIFFADRFVTLKAFVLQNVHSERRSLLTCRTASGERGATTPHRTSCVFYSLISDSDLDSNSDPIRAVSPEESLSSDFEAHSRQVLQENADTRCRSLDDVRLKGIRF